MLTSDVRYIRAMRDPGGMRELSVMRELGAARDLTAMQDLTAVRDSVAIRNLAAKVVALLVVVALAVAGVGCSSGSDDDGMTITERKRALASPKVAKFLLEGQKAYERGNYRIALAMTDSAEQYAPDLADIHFLRGGIYTQLNRLGVAEAAYRVTLEHDPEYEGARYSLGLIAFRQGKLRDAIDWLQAEKELSNSSNLELELGRVYAKLGEPDSARMAYEGAIRLDSTNSTAYMWLGQLQEELGEMDEALRLSEAGLKQRPDHIDYQYIVGSLLFRTGDIERAAEYLRPVAEARPWHHGAQFNMGQVLMRQGKEEEAKPYFTQADSAQQVQQKIADAEREIGREPDEIKHWVDLALLLRHIGEIDKAIESFKVATAIDPWNMHLQNNLALLLMENGENDAAIRRFEAIVKIDSTLPDVWLNLGAAYANAGHSPQAEAAWQKVMKLKPGHPTARAYLARLSEVRGGP